MCVIKPPPPDPKVVVVGGQDYVLSQADALTKNHNNKQINGL